MKFLRFLYRNLPRLLATEKLSHLFTLITITLSLALLGGMQGITQGMIRLLREYGSEGSLILFLKHESEEGERARLAREIRNKLPQARVRVRTPAELSQDLKVLLGIRGDGELEEFAPWVIEVYASQPIPVQLVEGWSRYPGVLYADTGTMERQRLEELVTGAQQLTLGISLFLFLLLFFIITSTMGLLLNRRREEIELMDLLGAPHLWIYGLYASLGALHGGAGALLALLLLAGPIPGVLDPWLQWLGFPRFPPPSFSLLLTLLLLGVVVGKVAALVSVRNFLKKQWH